MCSCTFNADRGYVCRLEAWAAESMRKQPRFPAAVIEQSLRELQDKCVKRNAVGKTAVNEEKT